MYSALGYILQYMPIELISDLYPETRYMLYKVKLLYQQGRICKYQHEPYDPTNVRRSCRAKGSQGASASATDMWKQWKNKGVKALDMKTIDSNLSDSDDITATLYGTMGNCSMKAIILHDLATHVQELQGGDSSFNPDKIKDAKYMKTLLHILDETSFFTEDIGVTQDEVQLIE